MENRKQSVAGVISIVFAAINAVGIMLTMGYSLHIRHKFTEVHEDLGAELPSITAMVLNIHWSAWVLVSLSLLAVVLAKEVISRKWIPILLNVAFVLICIAYWAFFAVAMMIPLASIIQQMENG